MKILQLTPERIPINTIAPYDCRMDYQGSCIFHGLRSLFGEDVVDYPKLDHMYKGYEHSSKLWGKGFTLSQTLDDIPVDREDIVSKISNNYFDLIILTSHNLTDHYPAIFYGYLDKIRELNRDVKIAVVNGKDKPEVYDFVWRYTPYSFQREILDGADERLIPISFSIPKEKIINVVPPKRKWVADIIPADHSHPNRKTHVYNNEEEYYRDYQDSYFAVTVKKGGWDCLRHYEIFANGCVPIFGDISRCPENTLTTLPKFTLSCILAFSYMKLPKPVLTKNDIQIPWNYIDPDKFDENEYTHLAYNLLKYTKEFLTTEHSAKYLLENCKCL